MPDGLATLSGEDRELLSSIVDALAYFRAAVRGNDNMLLAAKVRPFVELGERLRWQGNLRIATIAICSKVDGFGLYEPIEPARFIAGREHPMIVYCEVENFLSQLNDRKQWETNLSQEARLYNERGMRVWEDKRRTIGDFCATGGGISSSCAW